MRSVSLAWQILEIMRFHKMFVKASATICGLQSTTSPIQVTGSRLSLSYQAPPTAPCLYGSPPTAYFTITPLPASKSLYTITELWQHTLIAMVQATEPGCEVYYTNGTVKPDTSRKGTAAITGGTELRTRTPDHCSMELVATELPLERTQHHQESTMVLHTDSRVGLQVLQ
ncbi:hypothetical protein E2C01_089687 [Portunus trituberculatus]|uniref:RNase H type-1 domain-containing protein n=1 Tax=Portunus trituberculatus TaxID=210409 RepID=A0A5B7JQ96_PORTR|nr:hypothetical protein [Portunus trituberculatus]